MNQKLITITFIILSITLMIVPAAAENGTIRIQSLSLEKNLNMYLDGEYIGRTHNLIEDIEPGTYELYIEDSHNMYVPVTKTITIEDDMNYLESIEFERQGTLIINSVPSEASIFINGTLVEEATTNVALDLPFGIYEITVAKDGYAPSTQIINVSTKYEDDVYRRTFDFVLEEDPNYVIPEVEGTVKEEIAESTDTETSKESPGFSGLFSVALLGFAGILLKKRTE